MSRYFFSALVLFLCGVQSLFAQVQVTSNEAMEGRINQVNERNEWKIELKEDGPIRFTFSSNQMTQAQIYLLRGDGQRVLLSGVGGSGKFQRTYSNTLSYAFTNQGVLDVTVQSNNELPRGAYRLIVTSYRNSIGAYTLTLDEPKFQPKSNPMSTNKVQGTGSVAQVAGSTGRVEQGDIQSELAAIRRELKELREEIRMLKERK